MKVNKRIMDDNNPPWSTMQFSQCLTVACLIEQIKKIQCVSCIDCFFHSQEQVGIIIHRCVELANDQLLFYMFVRTANVSQRSSDNGKISTENLSINSISGHRSASIKFIQVCKYRSSLGSVGFFFLLTIKAAVGPGSRF